MLPWKLRVVLAAVESILLFNNEIVLFLRLEVGEDASFNSRAVGMSKESESLILLPLKLSAVTIVLLIWYICMWWAGDVLRGEKI